MAILGLNSAGQPWVTWATGPNGGKTGANVESSSARDFSALEPAAVQAASALNSVEDPIANATGLRMEKLHGRATTVPSYLRSFATRSEIVQSNGCSQRRSARYAKLCKGGSPCSSTPDRAGRTTTSASGAKLPSTYRFVLIRRRDEFAGALDKIESERFTESRAGRNDTERAGCGMGPSAFRIFA